MHPLRILIWHVHGSYLYYLTKNSPHHFFLPSSPERTGDYVGRWGHIPWTSNVHDVPRQHLKELELDCIIFQRPSQYLVDQHELLTAEQRELPRIYIEHDPPQEHPTDTRHPIDDPDVLLVHVTHFNRLMWNSGRTPTVVIEHGVETHPDIAWTGELERGIVSVNNLKRRGRRLGADIYEAVREQVPLDLIGMGSLDMPGGMGEVLHAQLPAFVSRYRFFFHPIRYTSLGLAVCEAMMCGLPVVAPATTEIGTVIKNGVHGFADTSVERLVDGMRELIRHPSLARQLGQAARACAEERFSLGRFQRDWSDALARATGRAASPLAAGA
jgi:glycosyltransferase involved in cell wall biosynthesis